MRTHWDDMLDMHLTAAERTGTPIAPPAAEGALVARLAWQVAAAAGRDGRRWRTCVCCRETFESEGPANLVCEDCVAADDPDDWI